DPAHRARGAAPGGARPHRPLFPGLVGTHMTTAREQRKAQMAAAAARRTAPDAPPAGRTAIRSKPVRITLDLSPELYRHLTHWADSAAAPLDAPREPLAGAERAMFRVSAATPAQPL